MRGNDTITVLSIPDIVILKAIDIDVQAIRIHVHVNHEKVWKAIKHTTAPDIKKRAIEQHPGPKSPPAIHTNWKFFN